MRYCKLCGKNIEFKKNRNGTIKQYCDNKCRTRFNNFKYYKKKIQEYESKQSETLKYV